MAIQWSGGNGQALSADEANKRLKNHGLIAQAAANQVKPTNQAPQTARYEGGAANDAGHMSRINEVNNLYKEFGWQGNQDNQGTQYWVNRMKDGLTGDQLRSEFKSAGESYLAQNPGSSGNATTNNSILNSIYQNTLGRAPDDEGRTFWNNKMNSGEMTPEQVRQSIFNGAENQSLIRSAAQGEATTVQDRMQGLLAQGSKYLDMARQRAAETANSRGFLNSSMAAGAGERAAIEAALPIAQQDAQTLTSTSLQNASQTNQMRGQVLDEQLQRWSQTSQQTHDKVMSELQYAQEQGLIDQKAFANLRGQYLDSITQLARERAISINEIQTNPNIPAENKQQMIDNLNTMFEADIAGTSSIFAQMPMWQRNWSEAVNGSGGQTAPDTGQWNTDSQAYNAVRDLYRQFGWEDNMTAEGVQYWLDRIRNGVTGDALRREFEQAGNDYLAQQG